MIPSLEQKRVAGEVFIPHAPMGICFPGYYSIIGRLLVGRVFFWLLWVGLLEVGTMFTGLNPALSAFIDLFRGVFNIAASAPPIPGEKFNRNLGWGSGVVDILY